jgi:hypothetical protein
MYSRKQLDEKSPLRYVAPFPLKVEVLRAGIAKLAPRLDAQPHQLPLG